MTIQTTTWTAGDQVAINGTSNTYTRQAEDWASDDGAVCGVSDDSINVRVSDGRARIAHRVSREDLPPVLPDTSEVIGYLAKTLDNIEELDDDLPWTNVEVCELVQDALDLLVPPPVPEPVWSVLSTDHERPTLAKVTWRDGSTYTANVHSDGGYIHDEYEDPIGRLGEITHVELLHTFDPSTHVPVERALIDEAVRLFNWCNTDSFDPLLSGDRTAAEILAALAALADGAEKGAES